MPNTVFVRAYPPTVPPDGPAIRIPVIDGNILVRVFNGRTSLLTDADIPTSFFSGTHYLGTLSGIPYVADSLSPDTVVLEEFKRIGLRELWGKISEAEYTIAGYAVQIVRWIQSSLFCPVCGHATVERNGDWGRECSSCHHVAYPPVSPAVLILVHDATRILLAHKPGWGSRYSILAGFVEPGESLEECVRREVLEEVGVEVGEVKYLASQAWPFPHQLMVGFTAEYSAGDLNPDGVEIDLVSWFTSDALPDLPPAMSLSRRMIDQWAKAQAHA